MKFKLTDVNTGEYACDKENFYLNLEDGLVYQQILEDSYERPWLKPRIFTGLKDCDGREIFEGDVIEHAYFDSKTLKVVVFEHGCFWLATKLGAGKGLMCNDLAKKAVHRGQVVERYAVIGNRWQPEFMEVFGDV
jgi:hypothetical protein